MSNWIPYVNRCPMLTDPLSSKTDNDTRPMGMFIGDWLPYSETFIYDQLLHQKKLNSWVFARSKTNYSNQRFPYQRITTLSPLERLRYAITGSAPTFLSKLKELRPHLIHAHYGLNGVRALPFVNALDCPLVVTYHGHDIAGLFPENRHTLRYGRYQRLSKTMFDRASLLLCCSNELSDLLIKRFGAPEQKVRVHRLGVDIGLLRVPERHYPLRNILMVGRLVEKKGFDFGIRSFASIKPQYPDLRLKIVGNGPLLTRLTALVDELGIRESVTFTGALSIQEVQREMELAHLLLAPSMVASNGDRESGVIVLKEAGATGLPTIGTHHGGIPEIIDHGETGLLVKERQVEPLAEALRTLVQDEPLYRRMSTAAREKIVKEFNTEVQNQRLEELLLSTLDS